MRCRKNYRDLTPTERDRFVQALHHVKAAGIVDQYASEHESHFNHGIHRSSHFLPWHREFIRRFEDALRTYHPDVTLPYWNSVADQSPSDPLWDNAFLGQFDSAWGLGRALGSDTLPSESDMNGSLGLGTYDAFWPDLESDLHNPPHRWVGGEMSQRDSPHDPVFFLHHCWIDLLWVQWQLAHPGAPFVSSGAGLGLNDPLMEWPDRTPADVLDHHGLGYTYDIEVGFGNLADGRPLWAGNFSRSDRAEMLFYYPGDDNWWLGTHDGARFNWTLAGNTANFGHGIADGREVTPVARSDVTEDSLAAGEADANLQRRTACTDERLV